MLTIAQTLSREQKKKYAPSALAQLMQVGEIGKIGEIARLRVEED
jgi:hypothetical protein